MSAFTFKCPNCGGELLFDPQTQAYKCEYCQSVYTQQQIDQMSTGEAAASPDSFAERQENDINAEEAFVYSCPSCGAEIVTDETTAATFCYYCHNPVTLTGRLSGAFLPDRIIPFQLGKQQAQDAFLKYIRRKKFVPKSFFSDSQIEKMSGVYYPYWVVDQKLDTRMRAEGTKVRVWRVGDTEYTERKYYDVRRSGEVTVHNMTRNALAKANRELVENVQPYHLEKDMVPFNMSYLSGFMAEKRDMERSKFEAEISGETQKYAQKLIRETASGYNSLNVQNNTARVSGQNWDYCLLPVWVLTYRSFGKLYYYAMNGQTGQIAGKLPVDRKKLFVTSALIGLAVFAAGLLGGFLI